MKAKTILAVIMMVAGARIVYADFHIQFDAAANRVLRLGGNTIRGNFATRRQAEAYWRSRPQYERAHSKIVGYPRQSGTSRSRAGGYSGYSRGGSSQQQMMQGLLNSFMRGVTNGLAQQSRHKAQQQQKYNAGQRQKYIAQERQRKEEEKRREELQRRREELQRKWRREMNRQIDEMTTQYATSREKEFAQSKGKLAGDLRDILSRANARETSKLEVDRKIKAIQDLNSAAYWGLKAVEAALNDNEEAMKVYSDFANAASRGNTVDGGLEKNSSIPEPSSPQRVDFQVEFYACLNEEVEKKLKTIQTFKAEIEKADEKVAEDTGKVEKIKAELTTAKDDKEKKELDDLLEQANQELAKSIELSDKAKAGLENEKKEVDALYEIYKGMAEHKQAQGNK